MAQAIEKKPTWEKLRDKYRVVVYDDDTLGEVKSTRISGLVVLIGLLLTFLVMSLITAALISFTPLKYLVPGYADINNNMAYMELTTKLEEIEQEMEAQRVYTEGMKNFLNPTGVTIDQSTGVEKGQIAAPTSTLTPLEHYYFHSPLKGEISAQFDLSKKHFGIDVVAEENTPIKNILDGVVVSVDWSEQNGNTISIQHSNDLVSIFKHNSSVLKKVGEKVKAGEALAIIGNTGKHSSGPHVHFELWHQGNAINPQEYMTF
jgi:murein DD-endopeptidase MepM/ murein hydrolase activator NlpD